MFGWWSACIGVSALNNTMYAHSYGKIILTVHTHTTHAQLLSIALTLVLNQAKYIIHKHLLGRPIGGTP